MKVKITNSTEFIHLVESKYPLDSNLVVGIDGRSCSGKTGLCNSLMHIFDIIHMDDFFLPKSLRTKERLEECGGTVHYERFQLEIISKLKKGIPFSYKKFDCSIMDYTSVVNISGTKPILIEGAYALRPEFREAYDLKIFFNVSKEEQKKRLIVRNGIDKYYDFKNIWIPKEEAYIEEFKITKHCDFLVN